MTCQVGRKPFLTMTPDCKDLVFFCDTGSVWIPMDSGGISAQANTAGTGPFFVVLLVCIPSL